MSTVSEIHVGDAGTVLEMTIYDGSTLVDVSGTTAKYILLQGPNGTTTTKTASFVTDGTDGKISYTTTAGDFDVAGRWYWQGALTFANGSWHTNRLQFTVYGNL